MTPPGGFEGAQLSSSGAGSDSSLADLLDDYERNLIARALAAAEGNVAEAARRLRTDRPNLDSRMRRLGIGPAASDHPAVSES